MTKAFYERGWYGINIEPLPDKHKLLEIFRKRDINLQLGVGEKEGNNTFLVKGCYSSMLYDKTNNISKFINIRVNTMSNICRKFVPKDVKIEFVKIDVERAEKNVLLGFDFENYRPKIFCIESLFIPKTNIPEYKEWESILIRNDYVFAYNYGVNRFYYDKRIVGLRDKFNGIDFYAKFYKK